MLWKFITWQQYCEKQVSVSDFYQIKEEVVPFVEKHLKQDSTYEDLNSSVQLQLDIFFMKQRNKFKPWQLSQLSYPINLSLNIKYLRELKQKKQNPLKNQNKIPTSVFWNNVELFFTFLLKIIIIPFI